MESEDSMNCSRTTNQSSSDQGGLRSGFIGYMPGLDGLRALAVFAVIAYHLNLAWAPGGLLGVSLFFVLSGYLITNILLVQWERFGSIDLKGFWLRRARRLLPALFVMLAGVTSWIALSAPERLASLKQEVLAAAFYSSNWYLIFHNVSYFERFGPPSPLGHLWSLAVEEQFYLLWPFLLGLGLRSLPRRKWIIGGTVAVALASATVMALIYIPGLDPSRVYYGTDTRAFALLVGAVLAMVWPSGQITADLSGRKRLALDMAGSMGLLVVVFMIIKNQPISVFSLSGRTPAFYACCGLLGSGPGPSGQLFRQVVRMEASALAGRVLLWDLLVALPGHCTDKPGSEYGGLEPRTLSLSGCGKYYPGRPVPLPDRGADPVRTTEASSETVS